MASMACCAAGSVQLYCLRLCLTRHPGITRPGGGMTAADRDETPADNVLLLMYGPTREQHLFSDLKTRSPYQSLKNRTVESLLRYAIFFLPTPTKYTYDSSSSWLARYAEKKLLSTDRRPAVTVVVTGDRRERTRSHCCGDRRQARANPQSLWW